MTIGGREYLVDGSGEDRKETHIAFVLDESGSMGHIRSPIIDAFNEQLESLKDNVDKLGHTTATLVTFSGQSYMDGDDEYPVRVVVNSEPVENIAELDEELYQPGGRTPMYDAISRAIDALEPHDDGGEDTAFLVIVITDGKENASKHIDGETIRSRISDRWDTGRWSFAYVGAEQDADRVIEELGIEPGNTTTFDASERGVNTMSAAMADSTSTYSEMRASGGTQTAQYAANMEDAVQNNG